MEASWPLHKAEHLRCQSSLAAASVEFIASRKMIKQILRKWNFDFAFGTMVPIARDEDCYHWIFGLQLFKKGSPSA